MPLQALEHVIPHLPRLKGDGRQEGRELGPQGVRSCLLAHSHV